MLRPIVFAIALALAPFSVQAATSPSQPAKGAGGSDYAINVVAKRGLGQAAAPVYVFHAAEDAKSPRPVVVILPAWGVVNPSIYGGWIEHLARRGNLVIFPRYQEVSRTRPADATGFAAEMIRDTLAALADDPQARPDKTRVAFLGHLAGTGVAANLAALADGETLPEPKLVFALMPGGIASDAKSRGIPLADLSEIGEETLFVTMVGDRDHLPSQRQAQRLLKAASEIPPERKLFMRALSDDHGFPTLTATLASPGSPKDDYDAAKIKVPADPPNDPKVQRRVRQKWSADMALTGEQSVLVSQMSSNMTDTLDWLAYWRTFDRLMETAFAGRDAKALRDDPTLADMGQWSDGWPVRRISVSSPAK